MRRCRRSSVTVGSKQTGRPVFTCFLPVWGKISLGFLLISSEYQNHQHKDRHARGIRKNLITSVLIQWFSLLISPNVSSISSKDPTTALVGGIDNDRGNSSNDQEDDDETSIFNVCFFRKMEKRWNLGGQEPSLESTSRPLHFIIFQGWHQACKTKHL